MNQRIRHMGFFLVIWATSSFVAAQDDLPCLPDLPQLLEARLEMIRPKHDRELGKLRVARRNNEFFHKFVTNRISASYSYGNGLTVTDITPAGEVPTIIETGQKQSTWAIKYAVSLSAITEYRSLEKSIDAEEKAIRVKHRQEIRDETTKINGLYVDFLEARANYISCQKIAEACQAGQSENNCLSEQHKCIPYGYKMKKTATTLLYLTGMENTQPCGDWYLFLDGEDYAGWLGMTAAEIERE